ncbi:MAG: hypothetical protein J7L66_02365 [Anaerolineaceae bacterium]|nr:hypothetical protein [Anaerolineaceae bacterium]
MKNPSDEKIKDILKEDAFEIQHGDKKKKNYVVRFLLFLVIMFIIGLGFIYTQQYLLDLEAKIIVSAVRTKTAIVNKQNEQDKIYIESTEEISAESGNLSDQSTPTETPSPKIEDARTATIAVQLTNVAEFQQSVTHEP